MVSIHSFHSKDLITNCLNSSKNDTNGRHFNTSHSNEQSTHFSDSSENRRIGTHFDTSDLNDQSTNCVDSSGTHRIGGHFNTSHSNNQSTEGTSRNRRVSSWLKHKQNHEVTEKHRIPRADRADNTNSKQALYVLDPISKYKFTSCVTLYTLSLHIRGANEIGKRDLVGSLVNKFKINVGALQEPKVNSNQRMESKNITGCLAPVCLQITGPRLKRKKKQVNQSV